MRVRVPFGRQRLVGVVMGTSDSSDVPAERLKAILEVLDPSPVLDASALELLRWAAEYYHHPIGEVLAAAMPKALRLGVKAAASEERWTATADGLAASAAGEPRRAPKQRELLAYLTEHDGATAEVLNEAVPNWRDAARPLTVRGWVSSEDVAISSIDNPFAVRTPGPELRDEQRVAVDTIREALGHFGAFVLHGVTGSGKTEVYLRLVERALEQGRRALVLVPEIGLTPQLVGRFRDRFDTPMAVLHSALTDTERLMAWRDAFTGRARIVLGTRSAVFARFPTSASSLSTRSTTPRSNSTRVAFGIPHGIWPSFALSARMCRWSLGLLRLLSRRCRMLLATVMCACCWSIGRAKPSRRAWCWWTCVQTRGIRVSRRQPLKRSSDICAMTARSSYF